MERDFGKRSILFLLNVRLVWQTKMKRLQASGRDVIEHYKAKSNYILSPLFMLISIFCSIPLFGGWPFEDGDCERKSRKREGADMWARFPCCVLMALCVTLWWIFQVYPEEILCSSGGACPSILFATGVLRELTEPSNGAFSCWPHRACNSAHYRR